MHHLQIARQMRQDEERPTKWNQHMIGLCSATQVQHLGFFFSVSPSSLPSALLLGLKSTEELGGRKKRQSRSRAAQSNKTISQSQAFLPNMHQFPKRLIKPLASRLMTFFFLIAVVQNNCAKFTVCSFPLGSQFLLLAWSRTSLYHLPWLTQKNQEAIGAKNQKFVRKYFLLSTLVRGCHLGQHSNKKQVHCKHIYTAVIKTGTLLCLAQRSKITC